MYQRRLPKRGRNSGIHTPAVVKQRVHHLEPQRVVNGMLRRGVLATFLQLDLNADIA
jgi:hypothetical protein